MTEIASSVWHQLVVTDPETLSGASVASFTGLIIRKIGATAIVASDLVGACPGLMNHQKRVLTLDDFLSRVVNATQYDWGFFFLYSRTPKPEEIAPDDKAGILSADATIRLADDQYFYVYSRNEGLMFDLRRMYPGAEYKASGFEELNVPY